MLGIPSDQPFLGGLYQCRAYFAIIHTLERPKVSGICSMVLPVNLINLCADPSHRLIIPVGDPCLPFSMLKE
jgi:hypothetical protein